MTKFTRRTKAKKNVGKIKAATTPDSCVSVDKLESSAPEFISQLEVSLIKQSHKAATIFIDHSSQLSYVQIQRGQTSKETFHT